jgi:hypothetical protein
MCAFVALASLGAVVFSLLVPAEQEAAFEIVMNAFWNYPFITFGGALLIIGAWCSSLSGETHL